MEMNSTILSMPSMSTSINLVDKYMRLMNLIFSCAGIVTNFILLIVLIRFNRHQCTTYFLLILMTICDFLYCTVYTSILLTIDYYLNIINHQILCPLSFFLTPFTFTGSTLLLFICLLHFITNYIRRYETILGQISGRLSVVFVFAFITIRSVLGSTSVELISDSTMPHIQYCTIDMNTTDIVIKVQNINHIFAEVTDILVYIGWIILLLIYFISPMHCKTSNIEVNQKSKSSVSFLITKNNRTENIASINRERLTNKERHNDVSLIILSITIISIVFYLPVMINKFTTMNLIYREKTFLNEHQVYFLQIIQQTTHLFCLTIRFLPYFIYDKHMRSLIHQIIGMKIQRNQSLKKEKRLQKYICHFKCSRRQQSLELNNEHQQVEV